MPLVTWLEYTINVTKEGKYEYEAYVSSGVNNSAFTLSLFKDNGKTDPLCRVVVPKTGDNTWDTYQVVSGKLMRSLKVGQHVLHLKITDGSPNIDKIVLTCTSEDGIQEVSASSASSEMLHNLSGQKVSANYKGIVIKNGRKILVK